jgi:hypothetical protein
MKYSFMRLLVLFAFINAGVYHYWIFYAKKINTIIDSQGISVRKHFYDVLKNVYAEA